MIMVFVLRVHDLMIDHCSHGQTEKPDQALVISTVPYKTGSGFSI
jgi:hypothetical protein